MRETVQPGCEVDKELWHEFRDEVESRHGVVRGHLKTEMEAALRAYIEGGNTTAPGVETRLARIEAAVGVEATDGGTDTSEPVPHTHTPEQAPDEKPDPQASTESKLRWLAECVIDEVVPKSRDLESVPKTTVRDVVKDEYGFRSDTAKRYVAQLIDYFDLVEHPHNDVIYVTEKRRQELLDREREQARKNAQKTTEQLAE